MPPPCFLFVGPSLPDAADHVAPDVTVLPPLAAGTLLALPTPAGTTVGIVDGFFHQARAVQHKEILDLLERGVRVLGAASIGALRAAELHPFGMVGIGRVFWAYRDGSVRADDEVALLHGPAEDGYRHVSEPLVNIRATLEAAVRAGVCTTDATARLVDLLRDMPYRLRSYAVLGRHAAAVGMDPGTCAELVRFCGTSAVDVKRADTLELLAALRPAAPDPPVRATVTPRTVYLHDWQLTARHADDLRALQVCQVLAADFPAEYRRLVLDRLVLDCRRTCGPGDEELAGDPEDTVVAHGAHVGLYDLEDLDTGFLAGWTTPEEWVAMDHRELLLLFLVRSFRLRPGVAPVEPMLAWLRDRPAWAAATALADRSAELNERGRRYRADFDPARTATDLIVSWLCARWGCAPHELAAAAADRGLTTTADLLAAARFVHLAGRSDPEAAAFSMAAGTGTGLAVESRMP